MIDVLVVCWFIHWRTAALYGMTLAWAGLGWLGAVTVYGTWRRRGRLGERYPNYGFDTEARDELEQSQRR